MSKNSANFKLRAKGAYDRHLIGLSFSPKSKFSFISWKFNSIVHEGKNKLKKFLEKWKARKFKIPNQFTSRNTTPLHQIGGFQPKFHIRKFLYNF